MSFNCHLSNYNFIYASVLNIIILIRCSNMFTPVSVSLSGPAFSFLLYENSKSRFQQEGFLLGEIVHKETKTITDNDQQQINISRTIKINSMMPCPQPHYFYNGLGKIDRDKIREFLGNQFTKVVAWYKYQRISSFKFTLKDKILHKQLQDFFNIPPELFTCCLLINEVSDNGSTHLYSQAFMRCNNTIYDKLPVHIPNLSEPNNTYKSSEPSSATFNKIINDLKIDRKNTQGLVVINKIQNALQKHIDTVIENLSEAEKYLHSLEEEIKQLEIMQKLKKLNDQSSNDHDSSIVSNSSQSSESSPYIRRNSKSRDPIDSSEEGSPEFQRKPGRGRGGRGRGRRRGGATQKDIKEVNAESSRLRRKE
ncbi:BRISC complex subunit FAM175B-like [Anoplophora glabripennis]|uniref:BRISC complex subunit FAM175B-like n=1 Tax=Anoplophora glabripennis TaxID=217634 RepID=UPI000874466A|nr:BRISC complex subunit FAM175B-like [Anoplophora glabripennis]